MKAANALNFLLAIALVLMSAKLFFATAPTPAPVAVTEPDSDGPVRDFHEGHTLPEPEPPASPASASDFALAALGADASALPVPKADAVTTATPQAAAQVESPKSKVESPEPRAFRAIDVRW